ncbi:MAG TPA: M14 family metallopeptidase [Gemmatimonadaceae bacterium]|nr:M14 family metallopeptidase [Gemmatimonadaceae bacterium]
MIAFTVPASAQMGGGQGGARAGGAPARDTARKVLVVPGERAGPSAFPLVNYAEVQPKVAGELDWEHYHTSEEIEGWMRKWAAAYPDIAELYVAGETFGGRPVYQMTLTNRKTGKHTDKPAAYFEGGRHSGEITSTVSAFYLLWHLLDNYGKDSAVTRLLDTRTVYIRPLNNPDGSDMYRLTAQTNRSSVRPHDSDGDGLLDEDPGEDLDGDGHVRQMRKFVGKGKGDWDPDPRDRQRRLMQRVGQAKGSWMVYPEGIDNDGDGRYNEDGIGGLDLHRNYPTNWRPEPGGDSTGRGYTQGGAGAYPLSEPETRSVVMWMYSHPNISVTNTMDTAVPMHLRPPSTCEEEECMFPADLALYQHFDSVGLTHTNYPWAGNVYRTYATRVPVNPFTGDSARPEPLFGHSPDFGYFGFGAIWYGDELWNGGRERDYDGNGVIEQWEVLRYCDEQFAGKCFQKWTKIHHSQLGEVEVGGFDPKFWTQNGPPEVVGEWAKRQAMFNLYMAQSLPRVEIVDARVAPVAAGAADSATHELTVTVRNAGLLPTALEQAKRIKIVRPDRVVVRAARGSSTRAVGRAEEFWLGGGEERTVKVRVRAGTGDADGAVTVRLESTRGGVAEREVRLTERAESPARD